MTPAELPLRLIPTRKPHPLAALAVLTGCLLFAVVVRHIVFGLDFDQGMVSTVFPALIVATLYAGLAWGVAGSVIVAIAITLFMRQDIAGPLDTRHWLALAVFAASSLATVGITGGLREIVLRLDEIRRSRDEAEAQVRESEQRFRALADSTPVMMWLTGRDGKRQFVNHAYTEFYGQTLEQALRADWRDYVHPDDQARVREQIRLSGRTRPFSFDARFLRADGEWRWLKSVSLPRRSRPGEFEGFSGAAFDITEAKRSEAALHDVNELLADRVKAAVNERNQAEAALVQSQKLESLGQLTGGVAHDFNNLLTVVIGALDIILRKPEDAARRQKMGEAALAAAKRGERLTQQLLAFSRRQPLKPEVLDVDALLQESEPLLRRAVGEQYNLRFELDAKGVRARLDAAQLEAAILNLLINARDATTENGHIVLSTAKASLTEPRGDIPPGHYVRISVTDDGLGMNEDTLARAFEPFFTTKAVGKGTGLGLSQVYGFVRQSDGAVDIQSTPGVGTSISLMLPVTTQPRLKANAPRPPREQGPIKVLLVEDDPNVADLVEAMLRELGHTVVRAATADEGLRLAREDERIGLLLSDVIMPGGRTGVDLAREVTRLHPHLPIILSSGYTGATVAEADRAPWPMLRKPYTLDGLRAAIAAAVDADAGETSAKP